MQEFKDTSVGATDYRTMQKRLQYLDEQNRALVAIQDKLERLSDFRSDMILSHDIPEILRSRSRRQRQSQPRRDQHRQHRHLRHYLAHGDDQSVGQSSRSDQRRHINFTVVFSEPVTGFDANGRHVQSTAGTLDVAMAPVGSDGTTYTRGPHRHDPKRHGDCHRAGSAAQDAVGHPNRASTSTDNSVTYDITPPTVTVNQATDQADPTKDDPVNFVVTFSEPVADFTAGDVTIGGTAGAKTAMVTRRQHGKTYNVAVSGMTADGTVIVTVGAGVAHDQAGNANVASTNTDNSVTYDVTPPTVTVNQAAGQADPTNGSTINFTATFSEPVVGFTAEDVTIGGTAGATTAVVTPVGSDGTTYNIAVTGMTKDGTVTVALGAGVVYDQAGNPNLASTSTDNSVTYDVTAPTVTVNLAKASPTRPVRPPSTSP